MITLVTNHSYLEVTIFVSLLVDMTYTIESRHLVHVALCGVDLTLGQGGVSIVTTCVVEDTARCLGHQKGPEKN